MLPPSSLRLRAAKMQVKGGAKSQSEGQISVVVKAVEQLEPANFGGDRRHGLAWGLSLADQPDK